MRSNDLKLLNRLSQLDVRSLEDLDEMVCVLLGTNRNEILSQHDWTELDAMAESVGSTPDGVADFLFGCEASLLSATVQATNVLDLQDFCLTLWHFKRACSFKIPAQILQPLSLYLIAGGGKIVVTVGDQIEEFCVAAGDVFQTPGPRDLQCYFEADTKALFYDFPLFREARRRLRRFHRLQPVTEEEEE